MTDVKKQESDTGVLHDPQLCQNPALVYPFAITLQFALGEGKGLRWLLLIEEVTWPAITSKCVPSHLTLER